MPGFMHVPHPMFSPTRCVACQGNKDDGGFIDLLVDSEAVNGYDRKGDPLPAREGEPKFGHLYLCATCCGQVATKLDYVPPEHAQVLRVQIASLEEDLATARAELAEERARPINVVSVDDLAELIRKPAAEPAAA